jgi:hypothetical protein
MVSAIDGGTQAVVWELATGKQTNSAVTNPTQYLRVGSTFADSPDGTAVAHTSGNTIYISKTMQNGKRSQLNLYTFYSYYWSSLRATKQRVYEQ